MSDNTATPSFIYKDENGKDIVYVSSRRGVGVLTVILTTPTQIRTQFHKFRKSDGVELGASSQWSRSYLTSYDSYVRVNNMKVDEKTRNLQREIAAYEEHIAKLRAQLAEVESGRI